MNNKLLTVMTVFAVFCASNVSAQFGWGANAERPKTDAAKAADQDLKAADKAAMDQTATPVNAADKAGNDMMKKDEMMKKDDMMQKDNMMQKGMMPAGNEKPADMAAPNAGRGY